MDIWEAIWKSIVLGTVQGLTEFLPVSSSGHLVFMQRALGFQMEGMSMTFVNVMLHLGTLVAVIAVFWRDILALFKKPLWPLLMLVVATVPAGIVGLLFEDEIDALFAGQNGLLYLSLCFAVTALELVVCEYAVARRKKTYPLGWRSTVPMGLIQAVALFPGISRSGSTIVAGTVAGGRTKEVAKFSFLMSIPIILGSVAVELWHVISPDEGTVLAVGTPEIVGMVCGVVFSAVAGFFAIKVMLKVIAKANYKWFALYLVLLSLTGFWLNAAGIIPV